MANKKREENRRRSNGMHQREDGHREPHYRGEGSEGERTNSSGSFAHVGERRGPGPVPGAGEMHPREAGSSGAEGRSSMSEDRYPSRKTPSAEKGVKNRSRGMQEDD